MGCNIQIVNGKITDKREFSFKVLNLDRKYEEYFIYITMENENNLFLVNNHYITILLIF